MNKSHTKTERQASSASQLAAVGVGEFALSVEWSGEGPALAWEVGKRQFSFDIPRIITNWFFQWHQFHQDEVPTTQAITLLGRVPCLPNGMDEPRVQLLSGAIGNVLGRLSEGEKEWKESLDEDQDLFVQARLLAVDTNDTIEASSVLSVQEDTHSLSAPTEEEAERELEALATGAEDPSAYFALRVDRLLESMTEVPAEIKTKADVVRGRIRTLLSRPSSTKKHVESDARQIEKFGDDVLAAADWLDRSFTKNQEPNVRAFQAYLNHLHTVGKKGFGSYEKNVQVAKRINSLAADNGMRLLFRGQPVTIRCIKPARSIAGSFETRTATQDRGNLDTDTAWPQLQVSLRKNI